MKFLPALIFVSLSCRQAGCDQEVVPPVAPSVATVASSPPRVVTPTPSAALPDRPGYYLGRELAPTMSHEGAPWLIRPEREAEENTALMLGELHLATGSTACDIGAGNGYHALRMARAVGPQGRVVAVDIQQQMLDLLAARAKSEGVANVQLVLGDLNEPHLPAATCDLILMVDVYHELSDPAAMLTHLRKALRPRGGMALVEFRAEDPEVPIKPLHKMSKVQILREMRENGWILERSFDGLPWQHLMVFGTDP